METIEKVKVKIVPNTAWKKQIVEIRTKILSRAAAGHDFLDNEEILYTQTVAHLIKHKFLITRDKSGMVKKISWP